MKKKLLVALGVVGLLATPIIAIAANSGGVGGGLIDANDTITTQSLRLDYSTETSATVSVGDTSVLFIECDTGTNAVELDLPSAAAANTGAGFVLIIKDGGNAGTNNCTIDPNGAETIDGSSTSIVLDNNYEMISLVSDGTNWLNASFLEPHASTHITAGSDEIDGDQVDIDWTPSNYTPTTSPSEATDLDHLTAHLAGIDAALATAGSVTGTGAANQVTYWTGTSAVAGDAGMTYEAAADKLTAGGYIATAAAETCADSGDGFPGTLTIDSDGSYVELTVADADGCTVTMGETNADEGQVQTIVNVSASNTGSFSDSAGVSELAGAFTMTANSSLTLRYNGAAWVETSRSDN